jgi:hypothetical protein
MKFRNKFHLLRRCGMVIVENINARRKLMEIQWQI